MLDFSDRVKDSGVLALIALPMMIALPVAGHASHLQLIDTTALIVCTKFVRLEHLGESRWSPHQEAGGHHSEPKAVPASAPSLAAHQSGGA